MLATHCINNVCACDLVHAILTGTSRERFSNLLSVCFPHLQHHLMRVLSLLYIHTQYWFAVVYIGNANQKTKNTYKDNSSSCFDVIA